MLSALRPLVVRLTLFLVVVGASATVAPAQWRCGVGRASITPQGPMWMSGYAARDRPAEGQLTELWAKALAVEDAAGRVAVLVTLDLVGIDAATSRRVCADLEQRFQLARRAIALATTHTHSGPVVGENLQVMYDLDPRQRADVDRYTAHLESQIASAVAEAIDGLAPAHIRWGVGRAAFAVNRRNNPEDQVPERRASGRLRGPVDHDVPVLVVDAPDRETPLAILCGYACHATVLSGYQWSGDWPGYAQAAMESRYPGTHAMVWAGCGADQNPLPRRDVVLAEEYGRQIAVAVDEVLERPMTEVEGQLGLEYAEIPLAFAELPSRETLTANLGSENVYEARRARLLLEQWDRAGGLAETYPFPVQCWRLGDGPWMIFLGGEVVVDYALRLKGAGDAGRTWVVAYANDVMAYIPSRRVLGEGGYEGGGAMVYYGLPSPWSEDVEERVVAEVRRQIAALGGPPRESAVAWDAALEGRSLVSDHAGLMRYVDDSGAESPVTEPAHWHQRRESILLGMQAAMGPLPPMDLGSAPQFDVIGKEQGEGYRRMAIRYRTIDGDAVPAHLYVPDQEPPAGGFPAVLALHPTSAIGKRVVGGEGELPNRGYAVELVRRGYLVLAPDYPSMGDYQPYDFEDDRYVSGTMKGIVNHMIGVTLLAAREDCNPERIGAVGHSLGGHNAMFLGAFDRRVAVVVTSCGWTPFGDYYGGDITGWTSDRYMPRLREVYDRDLARVPFDMIEVVAAIAPRGFFSCSPTGDHNFDVAGVRRAEPEVRRVYALVGAEENVWFRYPEAGHDFPPEVREEAYEVLDRVLKRESAE